MATNKEVQELKKEIVRQDTMIHKLFDLLDFSMDYKKKYKKAQKEIEELNSRIDKLFRQIK